MSAATVFGDLFAEPLRNGVSFASRFRGTGIPMINMKEIFAYDRISDEECELAPLTQAQLGSYLLEDYDLLFARQSLTYEGAGKCSLVLPASGDRTWESHLIRVRLNQAIAFPGFYYYYFRSPQGRRSIESIVQQVAAAGIRGSDLARLPVPFPPLEAQRSAAEVLGALDDKIAANVKLGNLFEQLGSAKFKVLGLDFEPLKNAIRVDQLFDINPRRTVEAVHPTVIDMQALPTTEPLISTWRKGARKGGARFMNGDTLVARITPCLENRKTGYVDFLDNGAVGIGSTEFIVLRSKPELPLGLSYFMATSERFRDFAMQNMVGTSGRQRVSAADLARHTVSPVATSDMRDFGIWADTNLELLGSLRSESAQLARLRDALLPQLISGKLEVKDAEKLVEAAV